MPLLERTDPGEYNTISNVMISEGYLMWQEGYWKQGGETGVIVYASKLSDTSSKKEITSFKSSIGYGNSRPSIHRNIVVWEEFEKENPGERNLASQYYAIYSFNIDTGEKTQILSKIGGDSNPQVYGNYIIYADIMSQGYKVYNLVSQEEFVVPIHTIGPQGLNLWNFHNHNFVWVDNPSFTSSAGDILLLQIQ